MLAEQSILIEPETKLCPNCGHYTVIEKRRVISEKVNCQPRSINNPTQIKRITGKVGEVLAQQNLQLPVVEECAAPATELIVQVDGGHIPIRSQQKRSFEALAAIAYKSESIKNIDKNHRQIVNKNCVASAKSDKLKTLKD